VLHFVVGLLLVALMESPVFDDCKECACCQKADERDDIEIDEDVLEEEARVADMHVDGEYRFRLEGEDKAAKIVNGELD
jgi:hypothetical protein